MHNCDHLLR